MRIHQRNPDDSGIMRMKAGVSAMFRPGEIQHLVIVRLGKPGARLGLPDAGGDATVLLPRRYVPRDARVGDGLDVFIHFDSDDRLVASTLTPKLKAGEIARLRVKEVTEIGAFLDWGMDKDLFLPFGEQAGRPQAGDSCLVMLRTDREGRLSATMKVEEALSLESPYQNGAVVRGTVWNVHRELGAFVAVDDRYAALLPWTETVGRHPRLGEAVEARVARVRENGQLDLSQRKVVVERMSEDGEIILARLNQAGGRLALHDGSDPQEIRSQLKMSKAAFKRAVGRLLKEKKITMLDGGIQLP